MAKIKLDKYYTSPELAKYCVEKTKEIIGGDNITEYIEPSAGAGVFLDYLDKPYIAYDIEPEDGRVVKQDWLSVDLDYKKGRCIIGNPPFGIKNTLSVQFYKKSINLCDYISFILPISQYKNNQQMYEFDLIYSEDLKQRKYSDRDIHCCFNIYRRNSNGFNCKKNFKLKDITITEVRLNNKIVNDYDVRIIAWGAGTGRFLNDTSEKYAKEFYIKINNAIHKNLVIKLLEEVNWKEEYSMTATPNLLQWQVYKYLKEQIPELQ